MNKSSLTGLIMAVVVFLITAITATSNALVFLDWHAALIVLGGTASAALLSFSASNMWALFKVFLNRVLRGHLERYSVVISEIVDLAKGYREKESYLAERVETLQTPFLKEAVEMMIQGGLSAQDIDLILMKRAQTTFKRYEEDSQMFKTLAKFPPAFGLLGAVVGMVALMQGLGGADAIATVGPAMAVALVATLYGIALANFIFIPLGENLGKHNRSDKIIRQMVMDGLKLIRQKKHPLVVQENIKSYLLPSERNQIEDAAA
jgi:chemotaxis protein MotA